MPPPPHVTCRVLLKDLKEMAPKKMAANPPPCASKRTAKGEANDNSTSVLDIRDDATKEHARAKAKAALADSFSELDVLCSAVETAMQPTQAASSSDMLPSSTRGTLLSWIIRLEDALEDCPGSSLLQAELIKTKLAHERVMQLEQAASIKRIELAMQLEQAASSTDVLPSSETRHVAVSPTSLLGIRDHLRCG